MCGTGRIFKIIDPWTLPPGWSVSLSSSNGRPLLAVGGYGDNSGVGATWVFEYKGSSFRPFGNPNKVVGSGISGSPNQGKGDDYGGRICHIGGNAKYNHQPMTLPSGKSVSLAGDTLAVGGANQTNGIGATWIFKNKGSDYQQTDKLVGSDASGSGFQGKGRATHRNYLGGHGIYIINP